MIKDLRVGEEIWTVQDKKLVTDIFIGFIHLNEDQNSDYLTISFFQNNTKT